jgi:hypothetical protein
MGTGTKTISHGDYIAIVFDMTARAGSDQVNIIYNNWSTNNPFGQRPGTVTFNGSTWANAAQNYPYCYITFDDGTLGIIDFMYPLSTIWQVGTTEGWSDSSNPDERGCLFQTPWDCKVDGFAWGNAGSYGANSDGVWTLYSDPLGTPTSLASVTINGESMAGSSIGFLVNCLFASDVELKASTNYCLAYKANGSGNVTLATYKLLNSNASLRNFAPGGSTLIKATRNNSSGSFTAESPGVTVYGLGIRISEFNPDATGGGGGAHILGGTLVG